jgi:hypothetical protein
MKEKSDYEILKMRHYTKGIMEIYFILYMFICLSQKRRKLERIENFGSRKNNQQWVWGYGSVPERAARQS